MISRNARLFHASLFSFLGAACAGDDAALPALEEGALAAQQEALVSDLEPVVPEPVDPDESEEELFEEEEVLEEEGGVTIVEDVGETITWNESTAPVQGKGDGPDGPDRVAGRDEASLAKRTGRCIWPKFTRFPGVTSTGRLRYGQADVSFEICTDRHPSDWKASISAWHNTTASLQGYDFIKEQVETTGGGSYYRFYSATFKWRDCMPYFAWPCTTRGTFTMNFYAYVVDGKPYVSLQSASAPRYWTLYTTR
jgi:hypothetical protein